MPPVPDLRSLLREDDPPARPTLLARGGPATLDKLAVHAARTARAYDLDGEPAYGVSMFAVLDDIGPASLDGLLDGRLASYSVVHLVEAGALLDAGFALLPSFTRPHITVLADLDRLSRLRELLGPARPNPHHGEARRRRRRNPS